MKKSNKGSDKGRDATMAENPDVVILKTATAPKLSPRGEGGLVYQVGRVGNAVYVRIKKNDGGGSHSHEWVPAEKILAALPQAMRRGQPTASDVLASAYVGRSQCNSGFLVAALRAEGLFSADAEHKGMSKLTGDLDAWHEAMRVAEPPLVDGSPETAKLHPEPKDTKFRSMRAEGVETPDVEAPQTDAETEGESEDPPKPFPRKLRRIKRPDDDAPRDPVAVEPVESAGPPLQEAPATA